MNLRNIFTTALGCFTILAACGNDNDSNITPTPEPKPDQPTEEAKDVTLYVTNTSRTYDLTKSGLAFGTGSNMSPSTVTLDPATRYQEMDGFGAAITGSTGAGQKPTATTQFSWRNNNLSIYKAFNHQHIAEIRQSLTQAQGHLEAAIDFIPYRGDFARGIFATEVVRTDADIETIEAAYRDFYRDAAFTHYVDKAIDLKQVVNTNKALVHCDKYGDKLLITCCIDNLLKGAVGQAVQNMNLMFGLDERAGLRLKPSAF